ncbi:hypothetical protein D3C79_803020 [compost metagenome]
MASNAPTTASAIPSPATRTVLKMPVAMPARSFGTTLTARPSINPQGKLMPQPMVNSGRINSTKGFPGAYCASHNRPKAQISKPRLEMIPAENRCANMPASTGNTSIGAESANITIPASRVP